MVWEHSRPLETLSLGILGKAALWKVLPVIAEVDSRIPDFDFDDLRATTQRQFDRVEEYRMRTALTAFR